MMFGKPHIFHNVETIFMYASTPVRKDDTISIQSYNWNKLPILQVIWKQISTIDMCMAT